MGVAVVWLILSIAVGMAATKRGRDSIRWFLIAMLLSPLIAVVLLLASNDLSQKKVPDENAEKVRCPECAELIYPEAKVCKHCGATHQPDTNFVNRQAIVLKEAESKEAEAKSLINRIMGIVVVVALLAATGIFSKCSE